MNEHNLNDKIYRIIDALWTPVDTSTEARIKSKMAAIENIQSLIKEQVDAAVMPFTSTELLLMRNKIQLSPEWNEGNPIYKAIENKLKKLIEDQLDSDEGGKHV